jgi:uncharacterized delta-60 repeat protein
MKPVKSKPSFLLKTCSLSLLALAVLSVPFTAHSEAPVQAWVQRYSSFDDDANDYATKVRINNDGDVIVAGSTDNRTTGQDILVIKYSGVGVALWTNRYDGPASRDDVANDLAIDANGNIFVTGVSYGDGNQSDYVTIAYSSAGAGLWTSRYNGPGNSNDVATAVGLDGVGNVFVTGYSRDTDGYYDKTTIKYSGAGLPLWTNRFDAGNGDEYADALAVDPDGNVIVIGYSGATGYPFAYATVKYSGEGVALWTNFFTGPGEHEYFGGTSDVTVDDAGNVFVVASTFGSSGHATIKYSNSGVPLWTNSCDGFDRVFSVAVDRSGNVFVAGGSYGTNSGEDYATIAYLNTGVALWTNRYNGPANRQDFATGLVVDTNGNVIVTGNSSAHRNTLYDDYDYTTIAYSGAGLPLWTNRYNGTANKHDLARAIAVDDNGHVVITGSSESSNGPDDFVTVKYSSAGVALWTNLYNGSANSCDWARAMVVDRAGNVFVTGFARRGGYGRSADFVTVAYSSAGSALWTNRFNGTGNYQDEAVAVGVDLAGNVVVTGCSHNDSAYSSADYLTLAYSGAGAPLWTNRYNGPFNHFDTPTAIATGSGGSVCVTGYSLNNGNDERFADYSTIAYSELGLPLWTNNYDGPAHGEDVTTAVVSDGCGNVIVTGYSASTNYYPYNSDYATIAYSSAGVPLWTNRYNGTGNGYDEAIAVAVDGSGKSFVTGYSYDNSSGIDYVTIAYSATGEALWTNRYNGPANESDWAQAVAVDETGKVFVTGYSYANDSCDYATVAYSTAGVALWTNRYNGPGNSIDEAIFVVVDADGNVFITGSSRSSGTAVDSQDFATIKYSNAGVPLWTNRYNGPASRGDWAVGLALGPDGAAYVSGVSDGALSDGGQYDYVTLKYISLPEIASPPAGRTNSVGTIATFTVSASGSAPLRYQWQRSETNLFNGGNVSGVNSNTLTLANVQHEDAGSYRVIATNAFGSVTSSVAVLTVVMVSPITLSSAAVSNGVFNFSFTNTPGASFTVLTTTNVSQPLSNWTTLGCLTEISPGQFQFTDPQATTNQQRFYCVRAP